MVALSKINRRKWVNGPPCEQPREMSACLYTKQLDYWVCTAVHVADRFCLHCFNSGRNITKPQMKKTKKTFLSFLLKPENLFFSFSLIRDEIWR